MKDELRCARQTTSMKMKRKMGEKRKFYGNKKKR